MSHTPPESRINNESSQNLESTAVNFLNSWVQFEPSLRCSFIQTFVGTSLNTEETHLLRQLVNARLYNDPLRQLPRDVQLRILLSIEDPVTLISISRTCKYWWKLVMQNSHIWDRLITLETMSAFKRCISADKATVSSKNLREASKLKSIFNENQYVPDSSILWLGAIRWRSMLGRCWAKGHHRSRWTIPAHSPSVITCLEIDESNNRIMSASDNGSIGLWDLTSGIRLTTIQGHNGGGVWALKSSPHGFLVTGSTDRTLIIWDISTGKRIWDLVGHSSTVRCVEVVGRYVISGSRDGTLRVWDSSNGYCVHLLQGHSASVRCLAVWRPRSSGEQKILKNHISNNLENTSYVVSGSYDGTLRVWDIVRGVCISVCGEIGSAKIYSVAVHNDQIFSGGMDALIRVWNPRTGECINQINEHSSLVGLLKINDDYLVAGSTDGSISLWNALTLKKIRHIEGAHRSSITSIDFNRFAIVSGSERSIYLWPLIRGSGECSENSSMDSECSNDVVELGNPICLTERGDVIWRIVMGETHLVVGYQEVGNTLVDVYNFSPVILD